MKKTPFIDGFPMIFPLKAAFIDGFPHDFPIKTWISRWSSQLSIVMFDCRRVSSFMEQTIEVLKHTPKIYPI